MECSTQSCNLRFFFPSSVTVSMPPWLEDMEGSMEMSSSFLKHLNYAQHICLLSHRVIDLAQIALDLKKKAGSRLCLNTNKTKILSLTCHCPLPICINDQNIEGLEQFIYPGKVVCKFCYDRVQFSPGYAIVGGLKLVKRWCN